MKLESGTRLGSYLVSSKLGAGGMGEVYRARDTVLGREVAIKVLPESVANDSERIARFEREARLLASLNHPNIATIHGLEVHDGSRFLILELVAGNTLASLITRGRLPVRECVRIGLQIATALEAAHQRGVLHRDLKPGNVMVGPEGTVKLLDFGLAVPLAPDGLSDMSDSPTMTENLTRAGTMVGTAAYMSPEQVRGRQLDRRTDLWSFGCVLFEMLTGRSPFAADSVGDTIAAILGREPDWSLLPRDMQPRLRLLLERCLRKDVSLRQRDAGDALLDLETQESPVPGDSTIPSGGRGWIGPGLALLVGIVLSALVTLWIAPDRSPGGGPPGGRFVIPVEGEVALDDRPPLALSPDGKRLVYVARQGETTVLRLREIDSFESKVLAGTDGASGPFFSPDGEWVGFFQGFAMMKVSVSGAGAQFLASVSPITRGATWDPDSTIRFTLSKVAGVFAVHEDEGILSVLTRPVEQFSEINHCWPQVLPGSELILATIKRTDDRSYDDADIAVLDPISGDRTVLVEGGYFGRYLTSGHLIYVRHGELLGVPLDLDRMQIVGSPTPLLAGFLTDPEVGSAALVVSDTGTLAYLPGGIRQSTRYALVRVDRDGTESPFIEERRNYRYPSISPDGRTLAVTIEETSDDLYAVDIARGTLRRLTFEGRSFGAAWSPDGKSMAFCRATSGAPPAVYRLSLDDTGVPEPIGASGIPECPASWTPDGSRLLSTAAESLSNFDIYIHDIDDPAGTTSVLASRFDEMNPSISPDGSWIAYTSNESGKNEVYVKRLTGPGGKTRISTSGGTYPVWASKGGELFYRNKDSLMAVAIQVDSESNVGEPREILRGYKRMGLPFRPDYDVSPDGRWFVMVRQVEEPPSIGEIRVIVNWFDELRRLLEGE